MLLLPLPRSQLPAAFYLLPPPCYLPDPEKRKVPPGAVNLAFLPQTTARQSVLSKGLGSQARHLSQGPKDRERSGVQANQDMPAHRLLLVDDETEVPADGHFLRVPLSSVQVTCQGERWSLLGEPASPATLYKPASLGPRSPQSCTLPIQSSAFCTISLVDMQDLLDSAVTFSQGLFYDRLRLSEVPSQGFSLKVSFSRCLPSGCLELPQTSF